MAIRCVWGKAMAAMPETMLRMTPAWAGRVVMLERAVVKSMREPMLGALMEPSVVMAIRLALVLQERGFLQVNLVEGRRRLVWIAFV